MSKKYYYIPGVDQLNQMVETPASKERTEKNRFIISTVLSITSIIVSLIAAIASIISIFI